jgi:hypothetical protein
MLDKEQPAIRLECASHLAQCLDRLANGAEGPGRHDRIDGMIQHRQLLCRGQNWLTPCWRRFGGGCHLNRKMDDLIRAGGFHIDDMRTGYMKGPKPMTFMYQGCATP